MTRKHFAEIAAELLNQRPDSDSPQVMQWLRDARAMADVCRRFNGRFEMACGITPEFLESAGLPVGRV